tara:strand:+ start:223 stop:384 length:162 start_codon:yes stop_codon:yes gene_type:complete
MILKYKKPMTNKDYLIKEVYTKVNTDNYVDIITKKELRKLKTNTLLVLIDKIK